MQKRIFVPCFIALSSGIIAILCFSYILYKVNTDLPRVLNFEQSRYGIGIGYLFALLFHFVAFVYILIHIKSVRTARFLAVLTLITGIISLFAFGAEKVFYDEIARQFRHGMPITREQTGLNIFLVTHILFAGMVFVLSLKSILAPQNSVVLAQAKDDKIFTMAHCMGIISGLMGVWLTLSLIGRQIPAGRLWVYIPFYLLILTPYAITGFYWFWIKIKEKIPDWYDEKQVVDMRKAAFMTLLLSVPGLAMLMLTKKPIMFYYFPYYVFLIVFLFSAGTLYFFKKR